MTEHVYSALNMRSVEETRPARETIVAAATRVFGESGIAAGSLRQVAKESGVSPALVVHHFGGKEGLIEAVDEMVLREFAAAYADGMDGDDGEGLLRQRAAQTAEVMRRNPQACAYIGRALVEGTPGAARLFKAMIDGGAEEVGRLAAASALRSDADRLWTTLQHFFLIWAPLSFMPALAEVLGASLLEEANLERWVDANVELLEKGVYR